MKVILILFAFLSSFSSWSQTGKKVQFIGSARSIISNYNFQTKEMDSVTPRKSAGGYALIDLGFKISPNSSTEILGMIRVKNELGGFYGANVAFDVRQIYVRGVAGKIVRYQLGNIDYKLTPYTFYNHNPDMLVQGTGILKLKEDILNYESFYSKNNTWRQQGAAADFGLAFPKFVDDVKFNGFITRLNPSNLNNIFERFYGGGNIIINQSKYLSLGFNTASVFDLKGTASSENTYKNTVNTVTYNTKLSNDKMTIGIKGESGLSSAGLAEDTVKLTDFFVNAQLYVELKKLNLDFAVGYMDNGADFRSVGAQSKRLNYDQANSFFDRYTNGQIQRQISMYDIYNDPTLYSSSISTGINTNDPSFSSALPYGTATFNRKGLYANLHYADSMGKISANMSYYNLNEIRGQGTTNLKHFNFLKTDVRFEVAKFFDWKREINFNLGASYQLTNRNNGIAFEDMSLTTVALSLGAEFEILDKLYLLANVYHFESKGTDLLPIRNVKDEIINFNSLQFDRFENYIAGGLKFEFSDVIYFSAVYESNFNNGNGFSPYQINQFLIIYNMKF
jgi:curved DNA-binding protein CbpA